jgi:hypothetical protein
VDETKCYNTATSCTLNTAAGDSAQVEAQCQVTVWFNANASSNWEAHINPTDELGKVTNLADSNLNINNPTLTGIDIVQASIAYGTIVIGGTSDAQETSMGNAGNQIIDVKVSGSTMTGPGTPIPVAQQKWSNLDGTFSWDAAAGDPGPWTMVGTSATGNEAVGCINRNLAVRTAHASTSSNESIWWKLRIPAGQAAGSYNGTNTFAATASPDTCTGTAH